MSSFDDQANLINSDIDSIVDKMYTQVIVHEEPRVSIFYYNYIKPYLLLVVFLIVVTGFLLYKYVTKNSTDSEEEPIDIKYFQVYE